MSFSRESKPHERIHLLITASMNIYQIKKDKKVNSDENMLFRRKTDETIWKPLLPPF